MNTSNPIDSKNIKVEFLPCLNYAMTMGGQKCLEFVEITNPTADDLREVHVKVIRC